MAWGATMPKTPCLHTHATRRATVTRWRKRALVLPLLALLACQRSIDDPIPPDTTFLEAKYDMPLGRLSSEGLSENAEQFYEQLENVEQTQRFQLLDDLLKGTVDAGTTSQEVEEQPDRSRLLVVANATRVCGGVGETPAGVDPGAIHMTLKGSRRLYPVIWGSFDHCLEQLGAHLLEIDGDFSLTLRDTPRGRSYLYRFDGVIAVDAMPHETAFDFRVLPDGTLEIRIEDSQGDVVFAVDPQGRQSVRDRVGLWQCELLRARCENANGEVIQAEALQ